MALDRLPVRGDRLFAAVEPLQHAGQLQAVELPMGLAMSIATLSILWAILLPLLVQLDYKIRVKL